MKRKIAIVGLGYVGLPIAVAFGEKQPVVGFDINKHRIETLKQGIDYSGEVSKQELIRANINFASDPGILKECDFMIVAVPTPVNSSKQPDLNALIKASETVGLNLKKGDIVVFESTVYPGATEEVCIPILENNSRLRAAKDFYVGYSPERINPGDKEHTFKRITKVVSGQDNYSLDIISRVYEQVVEAGVFRASSIKVAEAAKSIENTQRDLNIALMNELAIIFEKIGIRTSEVLEAAGTKWNFIPFRPGLVGGHCIGVDPYYLTYKAENLGYQPQVILAGRRINDGMGKYIAEQTVKRLARAGKYIFGSKVGILGLTFKENVPDLRNSRVPDILTELHEYGIITYVHDPIVCPEESLKEYEIQLTAWDELKELDAIILAVAHKYYLELTITEVLSKLKRDKNGVIIDVKSVFRTDDIPSKIQYWSL